ncbi:CCA tRNA nucleotidyltransferase [Clostridium sp. BJN0013]|uniref:CCA tRNA nucleotidyltransferase n=1 Tax=Clostridium sp. BJN0013 TaxID=3236840 RepID=UPI0034C634F0
MDILKSFTKDEVEIMNVIRNLCIKKGIKAYIVGGAVRDAILKNKIKDIDICINVNPNSIAGQLKGIKYYKYYENFQTATLAFENGIGIDLIRCRKEYYKKDGELPIVEPSNIYDDLHRRDFTINSLAYDMVTNSILDIYGGIDDIKNKIIKKIHFNSYREDPTRIFRAIKYCVRYGFHLKDKWEIEQCIKEGIFNTISNDRIIKEIYSLCCEINWIENIYLCSELKIFNIDGQALEIKDSVYGKDLISIYKNIDMRILRLFYSLRDEVYVNILIENSILNRKLKSTIKYFSERLKIIIDSMKNTLDNYKLYNLLKSMNDYELTFLSWYDELNCKIYNYTTNMSTYKLSLNGNDIKTLGIKEGKFIKKILNDIMKVELNTALKWKKEYLLKNIGEMYKCL